MAPQALFLDPSHAFRLPLNAPLPEEGDHGVTVRLAQPADESEINRLYTARGMVPLREGYCADWHPAVSRSEEHTSELQSLMRISYAVFCLTKKKDKQIN